MSTIDEKLVLKSLDKLERYIKGYYQTGSTIPFEKWKVGITNNLERRYSETIAKMNLKIEEYNKTKKNKTDRLPSVTRLSFFMHLDVKTKDNALAIEKQSCNSFGLSNCKIQKFHEKDSKFVYIFRMPEQMVKIKCD